MRVSHLFNNAHQYKLHDMFCFKCCSNKKTAYFHQYYLLLMHTMKLLYHPAFLNRYLLYLKITKTFSDVCLTAGFNVGAVRRQNVFHFKLVISSLFPPSAVFPTSPLPTSVAVSAISDKISATHDFATFCTLKSLRYSENVAKIELSQQIFCSAGSISDKASRHNGIPDNSAPTARNVAILRQLGATKILRGDSYW